MAGTTKLPQSRLSPETAKVHVEVEVCAAALAVTATKAIRIRGEVERCLFMRNSIAHFLRVKHDLALVMRALGHTNARTAMIPQHPSLERVRSIVNKRPKQKGKK
jgi:hypothetical protein